MLISTLNNPSIVLFPPGRDGGLGPQGLAGPKGMICCCTQLVGNLSKGLLEPPTLTGSAHFTFLSSGFVQISSEIVSKTIKKLVSNTHFIESRHIRLRGESLHFRLTRKLFSVTGSSENL